VGAHIYGSVATELALPESDMDIMITGVNSFGSKETHQSNISHLFDYVNANFSDKIMVKSQKILHTQVPIIKLAFNLAEYYDEYSKEGNPFLPFINFDSIDSINPHLKELSVDISISDSFCESEHQGLLQSEFVKEKLALHKELRPVCLMLKKLLVENNFNDPYTGGLGSFSLFLMLYAALRFEQYQPDHMFRADNIYKGRLYVWFLTLYGENFNIDKNVIYFLEDGTPMVFDKLTKSSSSLLCVFDPTNVKNNTTQKAFRIQDIQKLFKEKKLSITSIYSKPGMTA
jgi:DNA polymerase sigma